jgi:acetyl-CoA acyltransferase
MGLTAEHVARHYKISREDQDAFAHASHEKALAAQAAGRFDEELIPVKVTTSVPGAKTGAPGDSSSSLGWDAGAPGDSSSSLGWDAGAPGDRSSSLGWDIGQPTVTESIFSADEGPRADTSLEALAKLKPAFHAQGTVTAGNSSQISDGAAAAVLMAANHAHELGLRPLGRLVAYAVTGCLPEEMGIGPITAIPKALSRAGLTLADIGLIELNEAFAAQALAVIRELGLDPERINVNGGAIALGHPLGCTGAKLTTTLLNEMRRRQLRYGMVTMCVGGGMGAAAIFEQLE